MFTFSDLIIIYTYVLKENIPFRKGYNSDIKEKGQKPKQFYMFRYGYRYMAKSEEKYASY